MTEYAAVSSEKDKEISEGKLKREERHYAPSISLDDVNDKAEKLVSPQGLYHHAWRMMIDSYYDKTFNGQDWKEWEHRYDGKLKTLDDAHQAIKAMLAALGDDSTVSKAGRSDSDSELVGKPVRLALDRDRRVIVVSPTVQSRSQAALPVVILQNKVVYIRLSDLNSSNTPADLKCALEKVMGANGLILDMRGNPGGLLVNIVKVASEFVGKDKRVFSMVDADGYVTDEITTEDQIFAEPMVILVNHETAMAAELLASSLREGKRAKIVGEATAGQVILTAMNRLEDGSTVRVPIARLLTSTGQDLSGVGVQPDRIVTVSQGESAAGRGPWWGQDAKLNAGPEEMKDLQLRTAWEYLQSLH